MKTYSDITIHHPFSSSVQKEKYLLSYNGQYYEASHAIVELVEELQRYEEEKAAIEAYVRKKEGKYTPEQVREVIEKFIDPIFRAVPKKRSFLYEKELFSAGAIDRFSDTFRFLFHKAYMMVVLVGMLALDAWFFFTTSDLLLFNNKVNIYMVAGLLVFMLASSFFHELGHASACKYFGVRHGGIGFGLYLNFPDAVNELILYLSNRMVPPFALLRNISMQLIFLALIGYLVYRTITSFTKRYAKKQ